MTIGQCKLTGRPGAFVKAHIIPKALTAPDPADQPFVQSGIGHPPIKRRTSWYDPALVTREGEDILSNYDNWAVSALRRHKLVWSGWGCNDVLVSSDFEAVPRVPEWGVRRIHGLDGARLRLFLLSLLWRAAASDMLEFEDIRLTASDQRRLRRAVETGSGLPQHRFPMTLTQFSTRGEVHNLTPLSLIIPRGADDCGRRDMRIFRFYFDGLVVHVHRAMSTAQVAAQGDTIVGAAPSLTVGTVTFEGSWQQSNMSRLMLNAAAEWPGRLARAEGGL